MSRIAILLLVVAVLADSCCLAQKFHYSKGWTNGRKRMSIPALPAADQQQPQQQQQQQRSFANSQPKMANEKSPVANNWWFDLKSQETDFPRNRQPVFEQPDQPRLEPLANRMVRKFAMASI